MLTPARQSSPVVLGILALLLVLAPLFGVLVARVDYTLSLGIAIGLVIFILTFVSTQFALYVLILATLLSPEFGSRSTQGGGVTLRLDDLLLLVIGFSQLTRSAMYRDVGLFSWTPLNRPITYYMLACVFATAFGMLAGRVRPLTGFFFVLKYFEYFIVYYLLINNLQDKQQAKRFLVLILITAAIVSFVAIAQIPAGGRVVAPFEGKNGEPNTLGGYLLLITSVVGGLLLCRNAVQTFSHRLCLIGLLGLMFIPILFTLSRATWLAAIPVFLGFWVLGNRKVLFTAIAAVGILVAPYAVPDAVKDRFLSSQAKIFVKNLLGM